MLRLRLVPAAVTLVVAAGLVLAGPRPAEGSFPGANGLIAFSHGQGISVVNADGSGLRQLVSDGSQPSWSPDGTRLAFTRLSGDPMTAGAAIHVVNADGSGEQRLTDDATFNGNPAWSPDGQQIAFVSRRDHDLGDIYVMNADGTNVRRLTSNDVIDEFPDWSPDGTRIAFHRRGGDGGAQIYVMNADGSGQTALASSVALGYPSWAPDGTRIAYQGPGEHFTDLFVVNADGSGRTRLTEHPGIDEEPAWSPDGSLIAFFSNQDDYDPDEPHQGARELHLIAPDGSNVTKVLAGGNPVIGSMPTWQPVTATGPEPSIDEACPEGEVPSSGLTDIDGNTHERAIECVVWWEVAQGVGGDRYAPTQAVRRDQMASFIARAVEAAGGELPEPSDQGFDDIDGNVHADRINQLAEVGIVRGVTATSYAPGRSVTREQMATFLVRAFEHTSGTTLSSSGDHFDDDNGRVHEDNTNKAAEAGFAAGTGPRRFSPASPVRRDQMASFLARTLNKLVDDGHTTTPGDNGDDGDDGDDDCTLEIPVVEICVL